MWRPCWPRGFPRYESVPLEHRLDEVPFRTQGPDPLFGLAYERREGKKVRMPDWYLQWNRVE